MIHYRVFVLQDGTLILGGTIWENVNYESYTQEITDPVRLEVVRFQDGKMVYETFVMKVWMPMMEGNSVHLQTSHILTCFAIKQEYIDQYKMYMAAKQISETQGTENSAAPTAPEQFNPFVNREEDESEDEETGDLFEDEFNFENLIPAKRVLH